MRFAIAITVLALSGIALVLGIGQRTFLAPPEAVSYTLGESTDLKYAVIPAEVFTSVEGEPSVTVVGDGAFAAVGSQRDVAAWVAIFDHGEMSNEIGSKTLVISPVDAETPSLPAAEKPADDADAADAAPETAPTTENTPDAAGDETPPMLRGSDLWIQEAAASEAAHPDVAATGPPTAQLKSFAVQSDRSVLVATSDPAGLQQAVTLTWTQDQRTPWAGPLLVAGGVLALAGAILYLLAVDHSHRGLGPRRGRKGPLQGIRGSMGRRRQARKAKRIATPAALAVVGMLALSGCSASYWPDFTETSVAVPEVTPLVAEVAPVPITQIQIDRILENVAAVADEADSTLDSAILESRFSGDALAQRTASYTIRAAVPDYSLIPPSITDTQLGYNLVQSTQGWPRTLLIAVSSEAEGAADNGTAAEETPATSEDTEAADQTDDEAASPSLALILTQVGPHENYLVSRVVALRGGITMPEASPAEEGTALLAPDQQTLVVEPGKVASMFATVLQNGIDTPEAANFALSAEDSLISRSGIAWVQQSQERATADGYSIQYSVTVTEGTQPITALSVSDGGALVAVTIKEDRVSDTAGSTTRVRAEGAVSALSGLTGQQTRLVNTVAHQLLFFVPSKVSGGQIELLGATSEMVGASN